ncbi:MAG TPA: MFS transporter [Pirellulales bacterium]|nr:MFS transporter [Pirellulales bacterium]
MKPRTGPIFALCVLFAINMMNFFDRLIIGAVGEDIRDAWKISDTDLGNLGTAFILLYAAIGIPLGRIADRGNRSRILTVGVFFWSLLTAACGLARNFWQMVVLRLAVGVGEATCAPASSSLIGDLFPANRRAKAMGFFMLGLPLGNAASFAVSGYMAANYGWQSAFFVAFIPGLLCAAAALMITEPVRGQAEEHAVSTRRREGSPYWLVLSIPTMCWIIASGALHNFNMYAIGGFLKSFLVRYHELDKASAGNVATVVYGLVGVPGLFLGGWLGDRLYKTRINGRLLVAATALGLSVPLIYFALEQPTGQVLLFSVLFGFGCGLMYTYYSTVYSTVQDVIEPSLRGTAMALYFCAMYALGGALGPVGFGKLSQHFTTQAALDAGVSLAGKTKVEIFDALAPFAGQGIHQAMYVMPLVNLVLAVVLFLGTRTVAADAERLQKWMREAAEEDAAERELQRTGA